MTGAVESSKPSAPTRVLYIAGSGRSGSTMLEAVLGSHPGVAALGEVHHLWQRGVVRDELCGCGEVFSACPFWSEIGQRAFGGWHRVNLDRVAGLANAVDRHRRIVRVLSPWRDQATSTALGHYGDLYRRIYQAAQSVSGAGVVVDSGKHATLAACLHRTSDIDLRVLHLVRDGVAVAYSWSKAVRRPEARDEDNAMMAQYSSVYSSALWDITNLEVEALRVAGARVRRIRYEDFVEDPEPVLAEALEDVGLADFQPVLDQNTVTLRTQHTVAGNPMRFTRGELTLRRDDQWRTAMDIGQRRAVTAMTAPLRFGYGYAR